MGRKNAGILTHELAEMGALMMRRVLSDLHAFPPEPQPEEGVTYAAKIDKSEARLDFLTSAVQVERQIRAFNPVPGAFFEFEGERYKILAAEAVHPSDSVAGAAPGAIRATRVQRAGKPAMDAAELLRGRPVPAGTRLA
jgi:methionyl-tRNA formyltransferase